jgi:hypothetical protein
MSKKATTTERKRVTWPGDAADEPQRRHQREQEELKQRQGGEPAQPKGDDDHA